MADDFRPGLLTASSAELLTAYQGRAQAVARGLADWRARRVRRERFPARVDSYDAATSRYAWTEQTFDANGNRYDKPGGRTGSASWSPAYSYGDSQIVTEFPYPTTLTRRVVTDTLGPVYEFPLYCACVGGGSGGGGVLVACCSNVLPRTLTLTVSAAGTCLDGQSVSLVWDTFFSEWDGTLTVDCGGGSNAIVEFRLACEAFWSLEYFNGGHCAVGPTTVTPGEGGLVPFTFPFIRNTAVCDPFLLTGEDDSVTGTPLVLERIGGAPVCAGEGTHVILTITE